MYVSALPQRWLARDSFPAFGEAKVASAFRRPGAQTLNDNPAPVVSISDRLGAEGMVLLCRQRCAAAGFKPHQSRAFYVVLLPQRWSARDSFPASGEASVAPVVVASNAAAGSHQRCLPLWGRWHAPTRFPAKQKCLKRVTEEVRGVKTNRTPMANAFDLFHRKRSPFPI